jgi:hypothetical protein
LFEHNNQAITHFRGCHGDLNQQYTLQGIKPDNMTHVSHEGITSGHSSRRDQGDDHGPPHPSARLPCNIMTDIHGWPMHYPGVHPLGMVG